MNVRWIVGIWLGLVLSATGEPVRSSGLVLPVQQVELAASSDGVVTEVLVKEGDWVKAGQVLVRLDSGREAAEAEYQAAVLEKRVADLAKSEMLFEEKIFSKEQVDERRMDAKLAETQNRLAQEKLESRNIRAPFAGLVLRLYKQRSESLRSLDRLAQLADLSEVEVTLYLDATNLLQVTTGQVAEVTIPLMGNKVYHGVVDMVDPVVDPASGQFRVKVTVANPAREIRTGTKANVVLEDRPEK